MSVKVFLNIKARQSIPAFGGSRIIRATNHYVFIRRFDDGEAWNGSAWETWSDGNIDNYDIPLTDLGGRVFSFDFPAGITTAGWYPITIRERFGANPALTDPEVGDSLVAWDGSGVLRGNVDAIAFSSSKANNVSQHNPAAVVAALLAATGVTAGNTWTFAKAVKVIVAWAAGSWRAKDGEPGTYEILDPDDGTTVIAEITPSTGNPPKSVTVL